MKEKEKRRKKKGGGGGIKVTDPRTGPRTIRGKGRKCRSDAPVRTRSVVFSELWVQWVRVGSSLFRVLFRKWFTRRMCRPQWDMPPPGLEIDTKWEQCWCSGSSSRLAIRGSWFRIPLGAYAPINKSLCPQLSISTLVYRVNGYPAGISSFKCTVRHYVDGAEAGLIITQAPWTSL